MIARPKGGIVKTPVQGNGSSSPIRAGSSRAACQAGRCWGFGCEPQSCEPQQRSPLRHGRLIPGAGGMNHAYRASVGHPGLTVVAGMNHAYRAGAVHPGMTGMSRAAAVEDWSENARPG
jgi:hypothetical protein